MPRVDSRSAWRRTGTGCCKSAGRRHSRSPRLSCCRTDRWRPDHRRYSKARTCSRMVVAKSCVSTNRTYWRRELDLEKATLRLRQGQVRVASERQLHLSRFFLPQFRPLITASKAIGPRRALKQFCGDARFVCAIRLSAMAAAASRLMTKIMIGFAFAAASAISARRRSPSCLGSLHRTATTASSPAARRYGVTS